jgi:uncharacterized protein with ATP-grasp and redox domains
LKKNFTTTAYLAKHTSGINLNAQKYLPEFLMTSEPGSFAQETIMQRKPHIIDDVIADNAYPSSIIEQLTCFKEEIAEGKVQPLTEEAQDVQEWNKTWLSFKDKTWLELPWFFAETYFYRRLLEIVSYFQHDPLRNRDPFSTPKGKQIEESLTPLSLAVDLINGTEDSRLCFENLLHASLWGNRIDLSNFTVSDETKRRQAMIERENLLIDDFPRVYEVFEKQSPLNVAFINDNVGMELGFDLYLADNLLRKGWAKQITFYLKPYPFFVSDAMPKDLYGTVQAFNKTSRLLNLLGKHLQDALSKREISLSSDWFWASPYHFPEMPTSLYTEISRFDIVIAKGDVNYRRLLSDRHWPHTTPITEIVHYFPASLLILRTLKGEIIVNLKEGQAERLKEEDSNWLINGKRGIIQYVEQKKK